MVRLRKMFYVTVAVLYSILRLGKAYHAQPTTPTAEQGSGNQQGCCRTSYSGGPTSCCCRVAEMDKEFTELKDKVARARMSSPATLCLMGLKDNSIPDSSITASSTHSTTTTVKGRLDSDKAWCADVNVVGEYIEVNLGEVYDLTGIVTQGKHACACNQWVTSFKITYAEESTYFAAITDGVQIKEFVGNTDSDTKVVNKFPKTIMAKYIRVYPVTYSNWMCLRFDIIDC